MDDLQIKIVLPGDAFADAESVRTKVFQEEQGIGREMDFDGHDGVATHIVVYHQDQPVGTGRMRSVADGVVKIERIAVLPHMRKRGIGKKIMERMHEHLSESDIVKVMLDAQSHAKGFYEGMGYLSEGEEFEEVGMPHIVMVRHLDRT